MSDPKPADDQRSTLTVKTGTDDGAKPAEQPVKSDANPVAVGVDLDPTAPKSGPAADLITSRGPDAEAKPQLDVPEPATSTIVQTGDGPAVLPVVLNASPGADPSVAPNMETQRTGPIAAETYRAPSMTRGSAINQVEVAWSELKNKLSDFDHDLTGLPADIVALVDFVKSRTRA